ncbi:TonB-dependent receptor plug domain-containing protein [Undibacterium sp. SXout7W]|uniref:TonB-dependent receptor plug domain-containing protein n=1 Tax=Undibacterium sp. SXout7W TaxID=3413049 RepID=UPI003BF0F7EC
MTTMRRAVLLALYGLTSTAAVTPSIVAAQSTSTAADKPADAPMQTMTIVGSRRANASATDTPLPIDFISVSKAAEQGGQFDLAQTLANISPSFNSTRQTGADGADLVDSAALRGLGSDQTLVLVNGKRRHTVALVNLFGARNRGNTGTDLNAIPVMAISNVQVLRDGAAAQYGSDAIAGVIDISLKKSLGCEASFGYSQYSVGDGKNYLPSAYCGIKIGEKGVIGITAEYTDRGRSNRADPGNPRTIGDTKVTGPTVYLNGEVPNGGNDKFYFTLGNQQRRASSAAWARDGVGTSDVPARNSAAMYPNGFVPYINADINDIYGTAGYRWQIGEWHADLSQTYGFNDMKYDISNTLNASIANKDLLSGGKGISPSRFNAGGFSFSQATTNLDFSRFFDGFMNGVNVAFGGEYRRENYKIFAGEPGSYNDVDGIGFGGNGGSQGFPGFQPGDRTDRSRNSLAAYVDIETDVTNRLKVQTAVRGEHYSDFGSTFTGKLAASYKASDTVNLRGSLSTGFRAPSLQQVYFSSTFTDFIAGVPMDVVLAPNGGAVANAAGIPKLKQETSKNYTLGLTFKPSNTFSMTADLYRIDIADRIVLSGRFDANNYPALATNLSALGVGQAQFFVNSINTKTQGVDITASHKMNLGAGKLSTYLGLNYSKTEVTKVQAPPSLKGYEDVLLSERERLFIEQGGPRMKATLTFDYDQGPWSGEFKIIHYGPQTLGTFSGTAAGVPNAYYAPKTSADTALTYAFNDSTKLTLGVNNLFDVKPSRQDPNETDNGFYYDSVQFGLGGRSYFAKLWKKF